MCFRDIYNKVEEVKDLNIKGLLDYLGINLIYKEIIPLDKKAMVINNGSITIFIKNNLDDIELRNVLLHEVGHSIFDSNHYLSNHRTEENNANLFMCLYLVHNEIWKDTYFDTYLIYSGISPKVARQFNDRVWQFKNQQIMQYGLTHQFDVNI